MRLVSPCEELEFAFHAFLADFKARDPDNATYYQSKLSFSEYVEWLHAQQYKNHGDMPPCHHFWFCDEINQIVGAIRIRHHIDSPFLKREVGHIGYDVAPSFRGRGVATKMLKQALIAAKNLGLDKVLVIADKSNRASQQVIEHNGGEKWVAADQNPELIYYWCHTHSVSNSR
ncbi:GNAT family N-acetyltransferase [Pseudoalteromonas xiamenensis]|uniref:GNAT family N-acetyltransferase n=1 Tax=Pseudoalteromonas xiamenensis TaxID=882626 RepID=A0A975DHI5_9GAMM|nr:GNAT family N-acetyltransferase [Pseudoalteromonas xiamenensis]QTH71300.1 GNAT family N-acetyltransferase [Pseudoalteromonas xiamenensis]